jgi:predicted nucleotidyltransferase
MTPKINIDRDSLAAFCRKWHIRRLWLFGSVLRDDFTEDSDVDVLYEFEEEQMVGFKIFRIEEELSSLLGGKQVDFVDVDDMSPRIKRHPYFSPELIYDEG